MLYSIPESCKQKHQELNYRSKVNMTKGSKAARDVIVMESVTQTSDNPLMGTVLPLLTPGIIYLSKLGVIFLNLINK